MIFNQMQWPTQGVAGFGHTLALHINAFAKKVKW